MINYNTVVSFEKEIAKFYDSPYAIATDCCTHAIELCLRYQEIKTVTCPNHTYLSIPMTFKKLNLDWKFVKQEWKDYYYIGNTNIIDSAVYWKQNGYIENTLMCLSFQYKKHLSIGRGGAILVDNYESYVALKKLSHDGRFSEEPWKNQNIDTVGYHYYMTPESAQLGLKKIPLAITNPSRSWSWKDYPDLTKFEIFSIDNE